MELVKEHWNSLDIKEFNNYLLTFSKGEEKAKWEQRIVNTSMQCIAVPSQIVRDIIRKIAKGNFMEFVDLWPWENLTQTFIVGGLIAKIKDINIQKEYLTKYSLKADNWATIDSVKLKIKENTANSYLNFAKQLCESPHTFSRRLSVIIMLKILNENNVRDILSFISIFEHETEYYVNMALSWLIAECFTKFKDITLEFFEYNNLSKFVINKAISKVRDSFRVSEIDKKYILKFKK